MILISHSFCKKIIVSIIVGLVLISFCLKKKKTRNIAFSARVGFWFEKTSLMIFFLYFFLTFSFHKYTKIYIKDYTIVSQKKVRNQLQNLIFSNSDCLFLLNVWLNRCPSSQTIWISVLYHFMMNSWSTMVLFEKLNDRKAMTL